MVQARLCSACVKAAALGGAGLVLILALASGAVGQGSTPQRGYQPGASYALSDIETINTTNGNLMLNLPLGKLPPGRGGLSGQLGLHYDSKLYDSHTQYYEDWEHQQNGQPHVAIRNMLVDSDQGGWHYGTGYSLQLIDRMSQYPPELRPQFPATENIYHWKVKIAFPDGSLHEFLPRQGTVQDGYYDVRPDGWQTRWVNGAYTQDFPYLPDALTYYSFDGTYLRLDVQHDSDSNWWNNPWTLYFSDGTKVTNNGNKITDRNGNYVEFSNITYNNHPATQLMDQLGRKVVIEEQAISDGQIIHVPGVGGADLAYQIHWKAIQVYKTYSTVFNDRYGDYPDILGLQFVVSEIDLPTESGGLKYLFGYNAAGYVGAPCCTPSYGWGELNSVTTPTGAQAQYQFKLDGQNGPGFEYLWREVIRTQITRKNLIYQQQNDGSSTPVTETWNYTNGFMVNPIIVNPDGGMVTQLNDAQRNYRTQQPDGTVIEKLWQANLPQGFPLTSDFDEITGINAYDPQRVNSYVKTEFTSIRDANGNLTKTAIKDYSYDKNGNVTSVSEYDWVAYDSVPRGSTGLPTGLPDDPVLNAVFKRVTTNTFARWTPDASDSSSNSADSYWNSTSPSLRNAIASSEVSNGSAPRSRAEFFYDDPAGTGNLTQQKSWDSTKGGYSNALSGANSISVSRQYDSYGNPTLTTDARGYQTQLYYASVGGFTDLYPTQIKTAFGTSVQRTETREYDFYTGLVTRATDADNNVSSSTAYDVFGRPTLVRAAMDKDEEKHTRTEYDDTLRRVIVRSDVETKGDGKLVSIQHYDQLGRIRLARQLEDATTQSAADETQGIKVQTRYLVSNPCQPQNTSECLNTNASILGSYQLVSNPYRAPYSSSAGGEATMGWTRMRNDRGGRLVEARTFGGQSLPAPWGGNATTTGAVTTFYDAEFTTVTDQDGKQRRSMIDGLGRLKEVYEDPNGANYLTSYAYDTLDNLTGVSQVDPIRQYNQTRTFVYDSLKRLTSADNPESGTISYLYDNNGNLTRKTDARPVSIDYTYDALNRNTTVDYSNTTTINPDITRVYDGSANGKGRLSSASASGSYAGTNTTDSYVIDSYDALGRPKMQRQLFHTNGVQQGSYQVQRSYDLAGHVTSQTTYPAGRTVNYSYDPAGRTSSFSGQLGDGVQRTYSSEMIYSPLGGMTKEKFGSDTAVYNKLYYNSRGQLAEIRATTSDAGATDTTWDRGKFINWYSQSLQCGGPTCNAADNNGNLTKQETLIPNAASWYQQYDYDNLNRLQRVKEYTGNTLLDWQQEFVYDRWGNRTIHQTNTWGGPATGPPINKKDFTVNSATNRLGMPIGQSGTMAYDNTGNVTTDTYSGAAVTRAYDAENRMTSETQASNFVSGSYAYNADGQRVRRRTAVSGQPVVETWQVYGFDGELLAEYAANAGSAPPQKEYGYRNGQLLVEVTAGTTGWGPPPGYTPPDPLVSGWEIKLEHLTELRSAVNQLRTHAGLSAFNFTDDPSPERNVTTVKADHIRQLRTALEQARSQLGLSTGGYAHPTLTENSSWIYAIDFQELRNQILSAWNSGTGGVDIRWLVTDQLGTPRIIIDKTGSLANAKRHDYLPFGEELPAGTGGRTADQGYSGDNIRQKFTQKERDNETGLDYFGARYYASAQGRFSSTDPLLSSGQLEDPQTWNRYSYTLNNPLRYVDPTGLFTIGSGVSHDEEEQIIAAYDALVAAQGKLKAGSKAYNNIGRALKRLGKPGEANGMVVTVGRPRDPRAGGDTNVNNIGKGVVTITFASKEFSRNSVQERASALAHEGVHADDAFDLFANSKSMADFTKKWNSNDNQYESEYGAFFAGAGVYQAIGLNHLPYGFGTYLRPTSQGKAPYLPQSLDLWNPSWRELDQKQIESKQGAIIRTIIESPKGSGAAALYGLTPPRNFQP
jgi:RHS repeat-associated protein